MRRILVMRKVLYLRDEDTGEVWCPTPLPAPAAGASQVASGAGYARFTHRGHGLEHTLRLWVTPDEPVKLVELTLTNRLGRPRSAHRDVRRRVGAGNVALAV
jgi:cyclic beta-1,2-glucan synthetase